MTEKEVFVIFTNKPTEDQLAKTKELFESLGLTLEIGASIPPKK